MEIPGIEFGEKPGEFFNRLVQVWDRPRLDKERRDGYIGREQLPVSIDDCGPATWSPVIGDADPEARFLLHSELDESQKNTAEYGSKRRHDADDAHPSAVCPAPKGEGVLPHLGSSAR